MYFCRGSIVALLVLLSISVICSGANAGKPIELTIYSGYAESEPAHLVLHEYFREYEKTHPNVRIKDLGRPDQNWDKIVVSLVTDSAPDIIKNGSTVVASLYREGLVLPVPDWLRAKLEETLIPVCAQSAIFQGDMFGVPVENMVPGLIYNRAVLAERGVSKVPATWKDFAALARRLTQIGPDGALEAPGMVTLPAEWSYAFMYVSLLLGEGGDLVDDEGNLTLVTPESIGVLEMLAGLVQNQVLSLDWEDWGQFHQGGIPFALGWPWNGQHLHDVNEYASAPFPKGAAGHGAWQMGHAYAVAVGSKHPEEAWELLEYLSTHVGENNVTPIGHAMGALWSLPVSQLDIGQAVFEDTEEFLRGFYQASFNARSCTSYYAQGITGEWRLGIAFAHVALEGTSPREELENLAAKMAVEMREFREIE